MKRINGLLMLLALAGCAAPVATGPSGTPAPSAAPTASSAPSAAPEASPSAAVSAAPAAFALGKGAALQPYDYEWIGGVYRDTARNQLLVTDALDAKVSPYRYMLRKLSADGAFASSSRLEPTGGQAPTSVDGVAFDLRGIPFYLYRQGEQLRVLKLVTATVMPLELGDFPLVELRRAGTSTIASAGREMLVAAISLESDTDVAEENKRDGKGGRLFYARAEEGEAPSSLFQIPDPLYPTSRMAFAPSGDLYLAGPNKEGRQTLLRVKADQTVTTLPVTPDKVPDGMWVAPTGEVLMAYDGVNGPARLVRYSPDGEARGASSLELAEGGYLLSPRGLVVDQQGGFVIGGRGFDGNSRTTDGLYRFEEAK